MIVDCESCPVRGVRCDGCMVTELFALEAPAAHLPLDHAEQEAVRVLLAAGLVDVAEAERAHARREPWGVFKAVG